MSGLKRRGFGHLVFLPLAAGLLGLACLSGANATANGGSSASHSSQGQRESKNLRLRLERLEAALRQLRAADSGGIPAELDQRIRAVELAVSALQASVPANMAERITALESAVSALQASIPADIDQRIRAIESDIGELQALAVPIDVSVNCASGQSIGAVLATHASGLAPLTVHVTGTCSEAVLINRSNVTLIGQSGATIQTTPSTAFGVVVSNGAVNVSVSDLSIVGGAGAASVTKGAHAVFSNVVAQQSNLGMVSADNGAMDIIGSSLRNNAYGAYVRRGGVMNISNSTVESNSTYGLYALENGVINMTGIVVRGNGKGVVARSGGALEVSSSRVENNLGDGILLLKLSSILFADSANTISNNATFGLRCESSLSTSYTLTGTSPGVITGNPFGNVQQCPPH